MILPIRVILVITIFAFWLFEGGIYIKFIKSYFLWYQVFLYAFVPMVNIRGDIQLRETSRKTQGILFWKLCRDPAY